MEDTNIVAVFDFASKFEEKKSLVLKSQLTDSAREHVEDGCY